MIEQVRGWDLKGMLKVVKDGKVLKVVPFNTRSERRTRMEMIKKEISNLAGIFYIHIELKL
jgi:hypothetical protein